MFFLISFLLKSLIFVLYNNYNFCLSLVNLLVFHFILLVLNCQPRADKYGQTICGLNVQIVNVGDNFNSGFFSNFFIGHLHLLHQQLTPRPNSPLRHS